MINTFLQRLARGPLLGDGAMGTMLYSKGVSYERCFEELNVSQPEVVQEIHRAYIAAGAELIETNTFGGNRYRLRQHGLEGEVRRFNRRAASIAREAREISGKPVFVAGSVGPLGQNLAPIGKIKLAEVRYAFREQIDALLEGGVDLILIETMTDLAFARAAVQAARAACDLPVVAMMTFGEDGLTVDGHKPEIVAAALRDVGADVVGANCSVGPQGVLNVMAEMRGTDSGLLAAMPNAGMPTHYDGRTFYIATPEYFATMTPAFVNAGVSLLGGCCGTTPAHISAMRAALPTLDEAPTHPATTPILILDSPAPEQELAPYEPPTGLAARLAAGQFVVSVEMTPPRGLNPAKMLQGAEMLCAEGADVLNMPDNAAARMRMNCISAALLIQQRVGLEVIVHFTPRDRNLLALQSDLLGAHAHGIRNILAITGDPLHNGSYAGAAGIWEVDSIGVVAILKKMNEGQDWAGNSIGEAARFFIGVGANPTAEDLSREIERLHQKLEAGAQFIMTQPVYDPAVLRNFLDAVGPIKIPILLGVMPLQSYRQAEYIHNELPGVVVPEAVRERMKAAGEHGMAEGIDMAREFVQTSWGWGQGIYLMPSFGRYEIAAQIMRTVKEQLADNTPAKSLP